MKLVALVCLIAAPVFSQGANLLPQEAADGWILLFDGESLFGWTPIGNAQWRAANGVLEAEGGESGSLRSTSEFADFILKCEFLAGTEGNGGILLRIDKGGNPLEKGYKLQIGPSSPESPPGSLIHQIQAKSVRPAPDQWHSLEVEAEADHIKVKLDGQEVLDGKVSKNKIGYIGLDYNKDKKLQFRNIKLKPLGMKPLFNGNDLSGWKAVSPLPPKPSGGKLSVFKALGAPFKGKPKEAQWSVQDGFIHVEQGPGQIETAPIYDDFVLQLDIRVLSKDKKKHPKSAVFFRGDPNALWSGYESQIQNGFKSGNRALPEDFGTGGIYGLKPARRVVGNDNEFVTETIVAKGRHIGVWVNGYLVTDFEDTRPEGTNPHKEARSTVGTISLQAHDEDTKLDFRNIRLASLAKSALQPAAPPLTTGTPGAGASEQTVVSPPISGAGQALQVPGGASQPQLPAVSNTPQQVQPDPRQAQASQLMLKAIQASDPHEQETLYSQVLTLDPSNQSAFNGLKDARARIEEAAAKEAQRQAEKSKQEQESREGEATGSQALDAAKRAFLAGNFATARQNIETAKKLLPNNTDVQRWDALIHGKEWQSRWIAYLTYGGAAGVLLLGIVALVILNRRKRYAYLEIAEGLDEGKRFDLADQDVIHIGGTAQDKGVTNEVVIRDVERKISRFHCEIHRHKGKYFVIDCESANGTFVNRRRIKPGRPERIKSGSRLGLASTCTLRLRFERKRNKT